MELQIPFSRVTLFTFRQKEETAFSRTASQRIRPNCRHDFLFGSGGGNGVTCAIGPGSNLYSIIDREKWAALLANLSDYVDQTTATEYLRRALDESGLGFSFYAMMPGSTHFPDVGFTNATSFNTWWSANRTEIDGVWNDLVDLQKLRHKVQ